jgi:hypothetical protein
MDALTKVLALLDKIEGIEAEPGDVSNQIMLMAVIGLRPQLETMIRGYTPDELDDLLLTGARWAIGLRSDDPDTDTYELLLIDGPTVAPEDVVEVAE